MQALSRYALEDEAIVDEIARPGVWRVRYQSSYWFARCEHAVTFSLGDAVRVIGRCNIMLLIEPIIGSTSSAKGVSLRGTAIQPASKERHASLYQSNGG